MGRGARARGPSRTARSRCVMRRASRSPNAPRSTTRWARAVRARSAILDGYLTKQPTGEHRLHHAAGRRAVDGRLLRQAVHRNPPRSRQGGKEYKAQLAEVATFLEDDQGRIRGIDPLRLDGDSLLDVPLLERKRLLDSVMTPADLVRVGAYVRPPLQTWIGDVAAARIPRAVLSRRELPLPPGRGARRLDPRPDAASLTHDRCAEAATVAACPPRS